MIEATNLGFLTLNVKSGWSAKQAEGIYTLRTIVNGETYTNFNIGFCYEVDDNTIESVPDCVVFYDAANVSHNVTFWDGEPFTFTVIGGADRTNSSLIAWLNPYADSILSADRVRAKYQSMLAAANRKTLRSDTELTSAVAALLDGYEKDSPLPIEIANETKMNLLLETAEVGSIYKYTGETTDKYENGALYVVEESE